MPATTQAKPATYLVDYTFNGCSPQSRSFPVGQRDLYGVNHLRHDDTLVRLTIYDEEDTGFIKKRFSLVP